MTPLPEHYLITPEPASAAPAEMTRFLDQLSASLAHAPFMLVQIRVKTLAMPAFATLAAAAVERCHARGARVVLNGPLAPATARELGADGIHLTGTALHACAARPVPAGMLLSVACHALEDIHRAERLGADCATLSPVLPTLSHPGAATLGWAGFAACAAQARVPLYALGGMTPAMLGEARASGAHGIAGIRGFWRPDGPTG